MFTAPASVVVSRLFHLCIAISGLILPNEIARINTNRLTGGNAETTVYDTYKHPHAHQSKYTHISPKALHPIHWSNKLKKGRKTPAQNKTKTKSASSPEIWEWVYFCMSLCPTFCQLGLRGCLVWLKLIRILYLFALDDEARENKERKWEKDHPAFL